MLSPPVVLVSSSGWAAVLLQLQGAVGRGRRARHAGAPRA